MDLRIFFSTFALIFLAELGDKTQLACMAASASTKSPWSIFGGAALALVLSALLAVLVGTFIQKFIPEHYIKGVASLLFIIFGILLFVNAVQLFRAHKTKTQAQVHMGVPKGILAKAALRAAVEFERVSFEHYVEEASKTTSTELKELFEHIALEEKSHLERMSKLAQGHGEEDVQHSLPSIPTIKTDKMESKSVETLVKNAIDHEKSTAMFYRALADSTVISELQTAFLFLAAEENSHVAHLEEFLHKGSSDIDAKHGF